MRCRKCNSSRIAQVTAKCSDLCSVTIRHKEHNGYVPKGLGIDDGTGYYIRFDHCLDCGQIRGRFPKGKTSIENGEEG